MRFCISLLLAPLLISSVANAADYDVDLGSVLDLEDLRPLIDECDDIGELEHHRSALESASDLENLRSLLEDVRHLEFRGCPAQIEGAGIDWVY